VCVCVCVCVCVWGGGVLYAGLCYIIVNAGYGRQ
jgi:hypothetical protein